MRLFRLEMMRKEMRWVVLFWREKVFIYVVWTRPNELVFLFTLVHVHGLVLIRIFKQIINEKSKFFNLYIWGGKTRIKLNSINRRKEINVCHLLFIITNLSTLLRLVGALCDAKVLSCIHITISIEYFNIRFFYNFLWVNSQFDPSNLRKNHFSPWYLQYS